MSRNKTEEYLDAMANATRLAKAKWLDSQMYRLLPPEIYAYGHSERARVRAKLARYLSANGIMIQENPVPKEARSDPNAMAITRLFVNNVLMADFKIRVNKGKVEIAARDYPAPEKEPKNDSVQS